MLVKLWYNAMMMHRLLHLRCYWKNLVNQIVSATNASRRQTDSPSTSSSGASVVSTLASVGGGVVKVGAGVFAGVTGAGVGGGVGSVAPPQEAAQWQQLL